MTESHFLRLEEIVGQRAVSAEQAAVNRSVGRRPRRPRAAIRGIVPVCKTTWELGVRAGKFPAPVKIGRTRVWPAEVIAELAERIKRRELAAARSNAPRVSVKPEGLPEIEASNCEARYASIRECLGYDPRERRR